MRAWAASRSIPGGLSVPPPCVSARFTPRSPVPVSRSPFPVILKESPDHHDADLVIRLYELRRDPVMRESRVAVNRTFWPRSAADVLALSAPDHPLNAPYRQIASYWEMVYGMVKHGVVHAEFMLESNGEGLFLLAKVEPYLKEIRAVMPRAFVNAEWVATKTDLGRETYGMYKARVAKALESR